MARSLKASAQALAVAVVVGLLALLVWKIVNDEGGAASALRRGEQPVAPDFTLAKNTIQSLFGFGDGVCVPVIRWVDQNVLTPVYEDECVGTKSASRKGKGSKNLTA